MAHVAASSSSAGPASSASGADVATAAAIVSGDTGERKPLKLLQAADHVLWYDDVVQSYAILIVRCTDPALLDGASAFFETLLGPNSAFQPALVDIPARVYEKKKWPDTYTVQGRVVGGPYDGTIACGTGIQGVQCAQLACCLAAVLYNHGAEAKFLQMTRTLPEIKLQWLATVAATALRRLPPRNKPQAVPQPTPEAPLQAPPAPPVLPPPQSALAAPNDASRVDPAVDVKTKTGPTVYRRWAASGTANMNAAAPISDTVAKKIPRPSDLVSGPPEAPAIPAFPVASGFAPDPASAAAPAPVSAAASSRHHPATVGASARPPAPVPNRMKHMHPQVQPGCEHMPLCKGVPQQCLHDPYAVLYEWNKSGEVWPYCTLCTLWSDSAHVASKKHVNRLMNQGYVKGHDGKWAK